MSGAGFRVQEVSDLAVTDICLEKKRENVTVRSGKGDKYRIVPLNNDVVESIQPSENDLRKAVQKISEKIVI